MPQRLAEAAVRVVARDGFDVLSVRTVAREAGVAAGTVQHHYRTRSLLLLAAFEATVARVAERVGQPDPGQPVRPLLRRLLREVLPLDTQRHEECVVWVALTAAAVSHPELADVHARGAALLRSTLTQLVGEARRRGEVGAGRDPDQTALLLAAVVDGLTLQGVAGSAPAEMSEVLDRALDLALGPALH